MAEQKIPLFIVDAFTKKAFAGNGAAICLVLKDQTLSTETMQEIAAEMNLSETAFVSLVEPNDVFGKSSKFKLRWFTPICEVSLCGHATLATASVLFNICGNEQQTIEFETLSGTLKTTKSAGGKITIDLPAYGVQQVNINEFADVVKATVGSLPVQEVLLSDSRKLLVRLQDSVTREELEHLKPQESDMLATAPSGEKIVGIIVTLRGPTEKYDFVSRYFAPWLGILEDPVTGSAHSVLGPYWAKVLHKDKLSARQCSLRGGDLDIVVHPQRVLISGDTVIVVTGNLTQV